MFDEFELTQTLEGAMADYDEAIKTSRRSLDARTRAQYEYLVARADRIRTLRADGQPSIVLKDLADGTPEVAKLKCDYEYRCDDYKLDLEVVQKSKRDVDILREQLQREYRHAAARP